MTTDKFGNSITIGYRMSEMNGRVNVVRCNKNNFRFEGENESEALEKYYKFLKNK